MTFRWKWSPLLHSTSPGLAGFDSGRWIDGVNHRRIRRILFGHVTAL